MPIRRELRHLYGQAWRQRVDRLKAERAGFRCEGCPARQGEPHPLTGSRVVLTGAHLNRMPGDDRDENVAIFCQRCHLLYDREQNRLAAAATRRAQLRTPDLFEIPELLARLNAA